MIKQTTKGERVQKLQSLSSQAFWLSRLYVKAATIHLYRQNKQKFIDLILKNLAIII